jgi:hypothetical protein
MLPAIRTIATVAVSGVRLTVTANIVHSALSGETDILYGEALAHGRTT